MRNPFVCGVGGVVSADIAVPDHERELEFYSTILTTGDDPLWRDDLMNNRGTPIIGLGARTPEYEMLPLQWMPHFQVADVAASVASAIELGGRELMHGKTDSGESLWAGITDPAGASFGIIPVVTDDTYAVTQNKRSGRICWLSLIVPDAEQSRNFYQRVVGWDAKAFEADDSKGQASAFEMRVDSETAAAEIIEQQSEDTEISATWLMHLPVDNLGESLRLVSKNGGEVIKDCSDANYAVIRDPVGVYLALQSA